MIIRVHYRINGHDVTYKCDLKFNEDPKQDFEFEIDKIECIKEITKKETEVFYASY